MQSIRAWRLVAFVVCLACLACSAMAFIGCAERHEEGIVVGSSSQALLGDGLVISQVYGGSFSTSVYYKRNFIELFNRSSAPVSLGGLSVQYQSETGNFGASAARIAVLPNVTVPAGGYFLIGADPRFEPDALDLPTVDLEAPGAMTLGFFAGKVALARGTAPLSCGGSARRCSASEVVDLVGYDLLEVDNGSTVSDWEGSGRALSEIRRDAGCTDTNDNRADFADGFPSPRNSSSPRRLCSAPPGGGLVISQVYGLGGIPGSFMDRIFVELFNRSNAPASLDGLSVQYTMEGNFGVPMHTPLPAVVVPGGGHFLIGYRFDGSVAGAKFVADMDRPYDTFVGAQAVVALARVTSFLGCGGITCATSEILDLVSAGGPSVEGDAAPMFSLTGALIRKGEGCTDTNDNAADFEVGQPSPRGALAVPHPCSGSPAETDAGTAEGGAGLVISQVFAGGGHSDASVDRDYVEILNRNITPVSLEGMSLQYGEGSSDFGNNPTKDIVVLPNVVIPGEKFFLIGLGTDDASRGTLVPSDIPGRAELASNGKLALARTRAPLRCGGSVRCSSALVVDMVGFGTGSDFEGSAAPALDVATALVRKGDGCLDTDDNSADFVKGTLVPRNSARPGVDCSLITLPPGLGDPDAGDASTPAGDGGTFDASLALDGGTDAGTEDVADDSGCSCRSAGAPRKRVDGPVAWMAMMALGLLVTARRRRARSSSKGH